MTKEQLQSVSDWFHASPQRILALKAVNGVCVGSAAAAFFYGVLVRPGVHDPKLTLRLVLTCGVPFVLLSAAAAARGRTPRTGAAFRAAMYFRSS